MAAALENVTEDHARVGLEEPGPWGAEPLLLRGVYMIAWKLGVPAVQVGKVLRQQDLPVVLHYCRKDSGTKCARSLCQSVS